MQNDSSGLIHQIDGDTSTTNPVNSKPILVITIFVMLFTGILTGYLLSKLNQNKKTSGNTATISNVPKTAGTLNK
ncbi:hypothetical protein GW881_03515, partial [Candidatus Roizmanbacteria bacterium]|nr:hypothetical protein [Candidatus Roizmanbacteria bacterium]